MYLSHHGGLFLTHTNIFFFKMGKNQRFTELSLESIGIKGARLSGGDLKQGIFFFFGRKKALMTT